MFFRKYHPAPGATPGILVVPSTAAPTRVRVMEYGPGQCEDREITDVAELAAHRDSPRVAWIDVQGLADVETLRRIAEVFSIHPLALEDAVNVPVRPKTVLYDESHEIVCRMARLEDDGELVLEQVAMFLGPRWLVTIQERPGDVFDPVRKRIQSSTRLPYKGPDYLAYALLDAVIDGYFPVIEALGEYLEELEDRALSAVNGDLLGEVHRMRRDLLRLRRAAWPQREMLRDLLQDESPFLTDEVCTFLQSVRDHAAQITDVIETYRDLAASVMDLYMSAASHRMNQVMQVLTAMASIFIPLTFIVGIYGMNFDYMPELHSRWGYPAVMIAMGAIAVGLLVHFRSRGWFGRRGESGDGG